MYNIKEVLKKENIGKLYKVRYIDLFCKLILNNNKPKLLASKYPNDFDDQKPFLEQVYPLYDIMNMKFEEQNILNIHEIFDDKYLNTIFDIVDYDRQIIVVNNLCNDLQLKIFEAGVGIGDLLENEFELKYILDMKFMEVNQNV